MAWPCSPSLARRRDKAAARASGALADFYAAGFPADDTPASELRLLSLDFETTGLDASRDTILSIGFVPVDGDTIELGGAAHRVLAASTEVGQSAVFHGITDDQIARGTPVEEAVAETLAALAGRAMLAHFAKIEREFTSIDVWWQRLRELQKTYPLGYQQTSGGLLSPQYVVQRIGEQWTALTRQDQERRELIANVSHDLRTPLSSLHGYLETLLLKDATLTPLERRRYLGIALARKLNR